MRLAFDPQVDLGALEVRWQAVALVITFLVALCWWWLSLRRARPGVAPDDLLFVLLGIVPGAVVGGRLVHGIVFAEAYLARPETLWDLAQGSLSLSGAVVGGVISGAYVCRLLGHPVRVWCDAAAGPLLLTIGLGKLSMLLAGGGQGVAFDGPWAVSFGGSGPWSAIDPGTPAHPAQAYEGLWSLAGLAILLRWHARFVPGGAFLGVLVWWLAGRFLAGFTWRDDATLGPLRGEQLIALLAAPALALVLWRVGRPNVTPP